MIEQDIKELRADFKFLAKAVMGIAALVPGGKDIVDATIWKMIDLAAVEVEGEKRKETTT